MTLALYYVKWPERCRGRFQLEVYMEEAEDNDENMIRKLIQVAGVLDRDYLSV